MSVLALDSPFSLLAPVPDPALGDEAHELSRSLSEELQPTSCYYDRRGRQLGALIELVLSSERQHLLRPEALSQAMALIAAIPPETPFPELFIERDGQIGFDWTVSRDRAISLNVGRGGMLGYAAINGPSSAYGRVPFAGALPREISQLLASVLVEEPQKNPQ